MLSVRECPPPTLAQGFGASRQRGQRYAPSATSCKGQPFLFALAARKLRAEFTSHYQQPETST